MVRTIGKYGSAALSLDSSTRNALFAIEKRLFATGMDEQQWVEQQLASARRVISRPQKSSFSPDGGVDFTVWLTPFVVKAQLKWHRRWISPKAVQQIYGELALPRNPTALPRNPHMWKHLLLAPFVGPGIRRRQWGPMGFYVAAGYDFVRFVEDPDGFFDELLEEVMADHGQRFGNAR